MWSSLRQVPMTNESGAMVTYEPRQIRKEAALRRTHHVPSGRLFRENYRGNVWEACSELVHGGIIQEPIGSFFCHDIDLNGWINRQADFDPIMLLGIDFDLALPIVDQPAHAF